MKYNDALKIIAYHYGFSSQADMLCEEAAEFTVALNKLRRGKPEAYNNIKEELADVLVIASQLRILLGPEEIDEIYHEKIKRQLQRIQSEDHSFTPNISKPDKIRIFEEMKEKQKGKQQ